MTDDIKKERPKPSRFSISARDSTYVLDTLKIGSLVGNERYTLRHLVKLLIDRKDLERLPDITQLYFKVHPSVSELQITQFYFWYKTSPITLEDMIVYDIYMLRVSKYGVTECNPSCFSERGTALLMWLVSWLGDSGNDLQDTLDKYFELVIPEVVKFNRNLLNTPRSILDGYGRNLFLAEVDRLGGKSSFIIPPPALIKKTNSEHSKLLLVAKYRRRLLEKGDLEEYDRIGKEIAENGIEFAYKGLPM